MTMRAVQGMLNGAQPNTDNNGIFIMFCEKPTIESLRLQLREAKSKSLGEEMTALVKLLGHRGLEWNDLLDALACTPGVNAETAALNLHSSLKIPLGEPPARVNCDRRFWEEVLRKAGLSPSAKVKQ